MIYAAAQRLLPAGFRRWLLHFDTQADLAVAAFASQLPKGSRVLDAGAGESRHRPAFANHRYLALDLAVGDSAWNYAGLDILGDLARLPFAGASFDAALNIVTLEHVQDPQRVIDELARVVRPGGRLLFVVPHEWEVHQSPHDYFRYTRHGLALLLERAGVAAGLARALLFLPTMIPLIAAASLFLFIFLPGVGLLDFYLARIGLRGPNWLGDSDIALWSVVGLTVWKNAGYYMLFYIAGLQNIPRDTVEAAMIDGANAWQRLRFVILPALATTTAFVTVIALIQLLTSVDHVIVLTRGGPSNATNLVLYYIFQAAHENFEYGKAAAATLISVAVLLALSAGSLRVMERGARGNG